ncbi:hypothetical protein F2Q70_00012878 [Brassica cretica]|uniref:Uncharacterized protein n=1 Tax=Brassica cretica TaxID=69181 RepID=A0A8S9MBI0_BRACR|nr:hypothetical protein F2Q70_00012878 [Brassica cretica]
MIAESVPFSSDKRYATTHVKASPQLQKMSAVRVLTVSHGFIYEPYALHEKTSRCLYVTYGSLRSLYSTQELAGVAVAILNFFKGYNPTCPLIFFAESVSLHNLHSSSLCCN